MNLRKAKISDFNKIWGILQDAIIQREKEGSLQWQDGYPNKEILRRDFEEGCAYVMAARGRICAYAALIFGKEPAYEKIEGEWLSHQPYLVIHRLATSQEMRGKGVATQLFKEAEKLAERNQVFSIKVDTNFDNLPMLYVLKKSGYQYCGEILLRGGARKAFEKVLK